MRRYWLLDQHGGDGPTALVETDGSLHIVEILSFGPGITSLDEQQALCDRLIGRVAPTMKPLVDAAKLDVDGVPPHSKLQHGGQPNKRSKVRSSTGVTGQQGHGAGRGRHGPNRGGSSGPR